MASMEKGLVIDKNETDVLEAKVYSYIDSLEEFIPREHDRNRLSFDLLKSVRGEGDSVFLTIKKNKLEIKNISIEELSSRIEEELKKLG